MLDQCLICAARRQRYGSSVGKTYIIRHSRDGIFLSNCVLSKSSRTLSYHCRLAVYIITNPNVLYIFSELHYGAC